MKLLNVLRDECIVVNAQVADKTAVLSEIARTARKSPILKDLNEENILQGLQEREELGSTGFGQGIAIPHCRLKSVPDFVVGVMTVADGVDFDALDGQKVQLIVFIIGPEGDPDKHIRLLSEISRVLLVPGATKELLAAETAESMRESFLRYTRADIDTKDQTSKNLLHVFVQDEDLFRDILGALNAESVSITVVDTENAAAYLVRMPLFSSGCRSGGFLLRRGTCYSGINHYRKAEHPR